MTLTWELVGTIVVMFAVLTIAQRVREKIAKTKVRDTTTSVAEGDLTKEQEDEYVKTVLLVQTKCKWATECYLDDEDVVYDGYNKQMLDKTIQTCLLDAYAIDDDFYKSAALAEVIINCVRI